MTPTAWVLAAAALVVLGDWMTAVWARSGSLLWGAGAMAVLTVACGAYFPAIRAGGLARVVALGSVLAALGGVLVGCLVMGETLSPRRAAGVVLALVAVVLLESA